MSHLFKTNQRLLFFYKLIKILIILLLIVLFYFGLKSYTGNKILYSVFSIISNYLIFFAFRKKAIFFETFFSLLLWLGFWFKFTCTISFTSGHFKEGVGLFDYSKTLFNESLFVSSIGLAAFIFSGHFREIFLFNYPSKIKKINFKNNFFSFGQKKIWLFFLILTIFIGVTNFHFKIYQRGLLPIYELNFLISGSFKWLLLFGLSSISTILIFYEYNFFKKFFLTSSFLAIFETFISSFSMLSRGMIFNSLAIIFGIYKFSNRINKRNNFSFYFKSILFIFIFFYISVSSVNYIRSNYFYVGKSSEFSINILKEKEKKLYEENLYEENLSVNLKKNNSEIFYLLINRWVGIDGVMSVVSKKDLLNLPFLFSAFKERAQPDMPTFYELTFELESMNSSNNNMYENVKGNTLPGIIAFSYYSGSYYILFSIIFFISVLASYIELIAFKLSSKNMIFSALIGQVIAFRFIHFGYLPHQSYLLFGTIILTILLIFMINIFLKANKLK
jgi:hypothetical protein